MQLRPTAPASASWSLIVDDQGSGTSTQPRSANGKHGGTGLGLDIVRRSAALVGGVAEIGRGTSGGYRVEVQLPVRTPEP